MWGARIAYTVLVFGLFSAAKRSDDISIDRQMRAARQAAIESINDLPVAQLPFAIWDDMVVKSRRPVDMEWFRNNSGSSFSYESLTRNSSVFA